MIYFLIKLFFNWISAFIKVYFITNGVAYNYATFKKIFYNELRIIR